MNELQEKLVSKINKLTESHYEYVQSKNSYYNKITTLSVGLIGLLVGLKPDSIPDYSSKILFLITIILIAFCILLSLISQHYHVSYHKQQSSSRKEQLLEYTRDTTNNKLQMNSLKKSRIYKISEKLTFVFLVLYLLSLILYVYFLEF